MTCPPPTVVPAAPTGLAATTLGRRSIGLNWANGTTNQTEVRVERCTGLGCTTFVQIATPPGTATNYTDSGLANPTTYMYRVRAHNAAGDSAHSNTRVLVPGSNGSSKRSDGVRAGPSRAGGPALVPRERPGSLRMRAGVTRFQAARARALATGARWPVGRARDGVARAHGHGGDPRRRAVLRRAGELGPVAALSPAALEDIVDCGVDSGVHRGHAARAGAPLRAAERLRAWLKLENCNPSGSMKDDGARDDRGRRARRAASPGDTVVEYTGGSTGPRSRSSVGRRLPALIVMADCFTEERFQPLRARSGRRSTS